MGKSHITSNQELDFFLLHTLRECQHPALHRRLDALDRLGKEYLEHAVAEFLLFLLRRASDHREQSSILSIMSQIGKRAPVGALLALLTDREAEDWMLREEVAATLASLEEDAPLTTFISILQDPTEDVGLRESIAGFLGQFGERVPLEVLIAAVADPEPAVCAAAIESLVEQGARAPLEPILSHLTHPEAWVRKAAVRALSRAGTRAPIDPLVATLSDPDPHVREVAASGIDDWLKCFGTRVPLDPLFAALADEYAPVRENALCALSNHPQYVTLERVVPALKDENAYVRCAALLVLERMAERVPEEVIPALVRMTWADSHLSVQKQATQTILTLSRGKS